MKLEMIKKELPHGAVKDIAEKTGLSKSTVSQILRGKDSPRKSFVIKATAEYLKEIKTSEKEANEAIERVLKG